MEEKIEIMNLLQNKQILEHELQSISYGSVEIRENNSNKYIYVHYRESGIALTKYVGEYSDELYNLVLNNGIKAKELKKQIDKSKLLINATSVGMKEDASIIEDKTFFRDDLIVADCIYSPAKTKLLQIADKENCKIINGMGMLLYQGALAFEMWTSEKRPVDYIKNIIFN